MEEERVYPEAVCQFCKEEVEEPKKRVDIIKMCLCGARYWLDDADDLAEAVFTEEQQGNEVRVLLNYDLQDEEGVEILVHLVFSRPKETCYGAD